MGLRKEHNKTHKHCPACNTYFMKAKSNQIYCSAECRKHTENARNESSHLHLRTYATEWQLSEALGPVQLGFKKMTEFISNEVDLVTTNEADFITTNEAGLIITECQSEPLRIPVGTRYSRHYATIDYEDYQLLLSLGVSRKWVFNSFGIVVARAPSLKRYVTLARVIADTKVGEIATYKDGDNLNLRRSNIVNKEPPPSYCHFGGKYHDRAILERNKVPSGPKGTL